MKKFIPFSDRVLVRPRTTPEKKGGIQTPGVQKDKPMEGEVVAAGPGAAKAIGAWLANPGGLSIGDIVAYRQYAGREIKLDGEEFRLLRFEELDGRLEES